ncbi:MAG: hypothetical protein BWK79_04500, partial [Beggiatoa sp. IS2]
FFMRRFRSCFFDTFLAYSHHFMVVALVFGLHSAVNAACPDISGPWQRAPDNFVMDFDQDGCKITCSNAGSPGFDHEIKGKWSPKDKRFNHVITRKNLKDGCITQLRGYINVITNDKIKATIFSSDGRCDLPTNFKEEFVYERK